MRELKSYIDKDICIVQKDLDGGDSCFLWGFYWFAQLMLNPRLIKDNSTTTDVIFSGHLFLNFLKNYCRQDDKGIYWIRHPDESKWYAKRGAGGSQDQLVSIIACFSFIIDKSGLIDNILKPLFKRLGFFWNTRKIGQLTGWKIPDFISPTTIGVIIRALDHKYLKPFLWITDSFMILSVIWRLIYSMIDRDSTADDMNLQVVLFQSMMFDRTVFSSFAFWLYKKRCSAKNSNIRFGPLSALRNYFSEETEAPPMDDLWAFLWARSMLPKFWN